MKLGVNVALSAYLHVARSPRDGVELVGDNTMCQRLGFPRRFCHSSPRQLRWFICLLAKTGCKVATLFYPWSVNFTSEGPGPVWRHVGTLLVVVPSAPAFEHVCSKKIVPV